MTITVSEAVSIVTYLELFLGWIVYIIQAKNGSLYTGVTTDIARRVRQHAGEISGGAKFFRGNPPLFFWVINKFESRSLAQKEEFKIKKLSRKEKAKLINHETRSPC